MKKVAILYGLAEGPLLHKKLAQSLASNDFTITRDITQASCVIAHSGGIFELPHAMPDKTVLMVAPASGHDGHIVRSVLQKVKRDLAHHRKTHKLGEWWQKTGMNTLYASNVYKVFVMWRRAKKLGQHLPDCDAARIVVISVADDPWSSHLLPETVAAHPQYVYLTISGQHDDVWTNSKPYARLVTYFSE